MPVRWVDRSANASVVEHAVDVDRASEIEVFDALPAQMRALLQRCAFDFKASDARCLLDAHGLKMALVMVRAADNAKRREVLREAYPGHPALVNA